MLPKGLVLLISVSLATGVIRLAKAKILVQNIYSLETLAHVDVLCLDKTGTLTDGNMSVDRIVPLGERGAAEDSDALLRAYLDASEDNNVTIAALRAHFGADGSTADAGSPRRPPVTAVSPRRPSSRSHRSANGAPSRCAQRLVRQTRLATRRRASRPRRRPEPCSWAPRSASLARTCPMRRPR